MTDQTTQADFSDVAIIGAGPIGLEMAVAFKRAGIDYVHFDAKQIGYTVSWFAPGTRFFSSNERIAIAGVPLQTADQSKASREEYLAYLRSVVVQFGLKVRTYEAVTEIDRDGDGFVITTRPAGGERKTRVRRIVLATGGTDRPRRLGVPGEDLPHVSPYFQDPHIYFSRRLLIVGGKNSAAEAALRCHHAGAKVALSYRREALPAKSIKYWLLPELNQLIDAGRMEGHFQTVPVQITPTHVTLQRVDELFRPAGDTFDVPADFVLLMVGYEQDSKLLKLAGVDLHGVTECPTFNPQTMETNVSGIYIAGTATGGTQERYTVFIENCHVHVDRIMAAIRGAASPNLVAPHYAAPES